MQKESGEKLIVKSRRAFHDYAVEERYEAGLVLQGSEVKSIKAGKVDLIDAYAAEEDGEMWLKQLFVAPFPQATVFQHEPRRARKLLLHAHEIEQLKRATQRGGFTVVPLRLYLKNGRIKVELGVAKGKKHYDKRDDIAKKTADREARAAIGRGRKGDQ